MPAKVQPSFKPQRINLHKRSATLPEWMWPLWLNMTAKKHHNAHADCITWLYEVGFFFLIHFFLFCFNVCTPTVSSQSLPLPPLLKWTETDQNYSIKVSCSGPTITITQQSRLVYRCDFTLTVKNPSAQHYAQCQQGFHTFLFHLLL